MARRRLTDRQQERIESIQKRRRQQAERQTIETVADRETQEGRVLTRHGKNLAVMSQDGVLHHCLTRQNIGEPVCGDRVVWQPTEPGQGVVTAILDRVSLLSRPTFNSTEKPLAANITQLVVVIAPEPNPSQYLLDQYLVAAELLRIRALIAVNKSDLLDSRGLAELDQGFGHYPAIGYPLLQISARFERGLAPLIRELRGQTTILVGQSGVGKSSLVNALLPNIDILVGQLSTTSGLGTHTTSATTLYRLPQGGELIDSPGVRSFRLTRLDKAGLARGFKEFLPFVGRCRFSNCGHNHEPGCALIAAREQGLVHPARFANFLHMAQQLRGDRG